MAIHIETYNVVNKNFVKNGHQIDFRKLGSWISIGWWTLPYVGIQISFRMYNGYTN